MILLNIYYFILSYDYVTVIESLNVSTNVHLLAHERILGIYTDPRFHPQLYEKRHWLKAILK